MKKVALIPIVYGVLLAGLASFSVLDTLVIEKAGRKVDFSNSFNFDFGKSSSKNSSSSNSQSSASNSVGKSNDSSNGSSVTSSGYSSSSGSASSSSKSAIFSDKVIQTENLYVDQNLRVETNVEIIQTQLLKGEGTRDTRVYSAHVYMNHLSHLKTALAKDKYGINVTEYTSTIARRKGAVFAINGDTYGAQEKGYVLRNGEILRKSKRKGAEDLAIYADGSFESFLEEDYTLEQIAEKGAYQVFSFGPTLVKNGQRVVEKGTEVAVFDAKNNNQRVSIGIVEPLHYVIAVCDARLTDSYGMQLFEMADYMVGMGAQIAYNLDGGGSSSFFFNDELQNKPCTSPNQVTERGVSDIVYFS